MRRQLVVVFAAVTAIVVLAFVLPLAALVNNVAHERALDDAVRDASSVFPVLTVTQEPAAIQIAISRTEAGERGDLTVYLSNGTTVGGSAPPSERVRDALTDRRAWIGDVEGGAEVVAPIVRGDGLVAVVRVFVDDDRLNDGVRRAWLTLAGAGCVLVVGSVVLADRLARSITRPVIALARAAKRLGAGDLATRVEPAGPPEVAEVGSAFNDLAAQVDRLLHAEREDIADLAHRLRTPLAAMRLQLDQVGDSDLRSQLADSTDDMARALDQVIGAARRRARDPHARADLAAITADRAAFWGALADEQGRPAELEIPRRPVLIRVDPEVLSAAIDVLLENVFAHTAEGTPYAVVVDTSGADALLAVADAGPGFPEGDVVERGSSEGGTGLGLDIARRAAESAGGTLAIGRSVAGGARVTLRLPIVG